MRRASLRSYGSRGLTLVGVLIGTLLAGILAAVMAAFFGTMAGYMTRSGNQVSADQATSYIYGILSNRNLCDYALRTSSGQPVTWDFKTQPQGPVGEIQIDPDGTGGTAPTVAVKPPQQFGSHLYLVSMYLREPTGSGEPGAVRTTLKKGATTYDSVSARLVLQFSNTNTLAGSTLNQMAGGALQERYVDLTLGLDQTSHQIDFCYPQAESTFKSVVCSSAVIASQPAPYNVDCPNTTNGPPGSNQELKYCRDLYYVAWFQDSGTPICACQVICPSKITIYDGPGSTGGGNPY